MSTVYERSGAQVLPDVKDEWATVPGWAAHCAADADLRAKSPIYADLARRLLVSSGPVPSAGVSGAIS